LDLLNAVFIKKQPVFYLKFVTKGTGGLVDFLDVHPGISINIIKKRYNEVHFFDRHYNKGLEFYRFVKLINSKLDN
jgi:hypothetical protein